MGTMCASYLSLSGSSHGQYPRYSPLQRARAANSAGIPSIGVLWNEEITPSVLQFASIFEVEWFELSSPVTLEMEEALRRLSRVGVRVVKTGLCAPQYPVDWAAVNLRHLVRVATSYGLTVAVEPVAWGHTPSLHDTLSMMRQADVLDHPDVGICYDLWQVAYGSPWSEQRGDLPRIAKVEISGIQYPTGGSIALDAMDRPLLGNSSTDHPISEWVRRILAQQDVPVTYEVPNQSLREMPLTDAAMTIARDMDLL